MSTKIDNSLFSSHEHALDHEACPMCDGGELQLRHGKHGPFLGCNHYPSCEYIRPLHQNDGHIIKPLGIACSKCSTDDGSGDSSQEVGELVLRQGRYGMFIGCSNFPACQHIESLEQSSSPAVDVTVACPECALGRSKVKGHLVERKSRYGKVFFACNAYPKCKFSINLPPIQGVCSQCGFPLLVEKNLVSGRRVLCADRKCQYQQKTDE